MIFSRENFKKIKNKVYINVARKSLKILLNIYDLYTENSETPPKVCNSNLKKVQISDLGQKVLNKFSYKNYYS